LGKIHQNTLKDLEFPRVLECVSGHCITDLGREAVSKITPIFTEALLLPELYRTKEFTASFHNENRIPNHGFEAISKELHLLEIERSVLEIGGFRRILTVTETTKEVLLFFKKNALFYQYLQAYALQVQYTAQISEAIHKIIDKYGQIRDDASPALQQLRKALLHIKGQINASFGRALSQYAQADYLDEIRESIMENRRVLAVKAMHRKKVKGAVLGQSKTGSIVYIEPQETLSYVNELSHLLYEEDEEIKRILKGLTEQVRPFSPLLRQYQEYLVQVDVWHAKAKFAIEVDGTLPIVSKERRLFLKHAFHPLLLLSNKKQRKKTVPQTIELHPQNRIVVISGPNAGGKSITLKTVGLLQLMFQSGLLVPADPFSEFCLFDRILSDIGDNQSIENHLSTYSYRLKQMQQFLKKCNDRTLFLIDEFGTGSDPELGGALAETFLEVFYEREAFGIITTHYTNLKLLANELPFAQNANMQFDSKSLEPLYQLHLGEAGSSFTFEVAQKNGIPYSLINKAKKKIERGKVRFDKTIANLQKERSELRKTAQSLKNEEQKTREETKQLEETNVRIQQKLESYQELYDTHQKWIALGKKIDSLAAVFLNNKKKKDLMDELFKMVLQENAKRKKMTATQQKAKKVNTQQIEKEVARKVAGIRKRKQKEKEEAAKLPPKPKVVLKIGDRVRMIDGHAIGTIDSIEKQKAIVNYGMFTADVSLSQLEKV